MNTLGKNGKPMLNVYVVWSYDGPIMTTLLQYEDTPDQKEAMNGWGNDMWVAQAFDAEFNESMSTDCSYELAAIFTAENVNFIY